MSTIKTTMTADASQLLQAQESIGQSAAKVSAEYREATKEAQRLGTVASRAIRDAQTPLEQYNNKLADFDKLLKEGKLSQEQYSAAVGKAKSQLDSASQAGGALSNVMQSLVSAGAGFFSVSAALDTVTQAMQASRQEAEKAMDLLKDRFVSRGELAQVYGTLAEADQVSGTFRQNGAQTSQVADQIAFAIQSASLRDDVQTFANVSRTGLVGAESLPELIGSIKSLRDAFTADETGGSKAILSKALVASSISKAPAQVLVTEASKVGVSAKALGFGDEETLGAIATLSDPLGSPNEATTRLRSLLGAMEKGAIKEKTLADAIKAIDDKVGRGVAFKDIFGGEAPSEGIQAYRLLSQNFNTFSQITGKINAANSGDELRRKLGMLEADPTQRSLMMANEVEGARDINLTNTGRLESLISAGIAQEDEVMRLYGRNPIGRLLNRNYRNSWLGVRDSPDFNGEFFYGAQMEAYKNEARASGNVELIKALDKMNEIQEQLRVELASQRAARARPAVPAPER